MSTTETKHRRGTATQCNAFTPAEAEIVVDTTNNRLRVGDGIKLGGYHIPNHKDVQQQVFSFCTVGGSANSITLTSGSGTPVAAYASPLKLSFKATATNTSSVQVNVDGLGLKDIYKLSGTSLVALTGGEIVNGLIYDITYDGVQFQLSVGSGSLLPDYQIFTSSGTWTKPSGFPSSARVLIECWGGGGGGSADQNVSAANGGNGGSSSFGSWVTAYGGTGGQAWAVGGCGGGLFATASVGAVNDNNEGRGSGTTGASAQNRNGYFIGGGGGGSAQSAGSSVYGGGGGAGYNTAAGSSNFGGNGGSLATAGTAPGGGGGGGNTTSSAGGGGGSYKSRWLPLSSLGSTESVTVGAGGSAGGNGGAGARGEARITVIA